jgi:hypothetical protein
VRGSRLVCIVACCCAIQLVLFPLDRAAQSHGKDLPITIRAQEMDNWCWAASSQMAMETLTPTRHSDFAQCLQAVTGAPS